MVVRGGEKFWDDDSAGIFISNESLPDSCRPDEDTRNFRASFARQLAFRALQRMGLPSELCDDVHIVISEFVGNTARHGDGLEDLDVVWTTESEGTAYIVVTNETGQSAIGSPAAVSDDQAEGGRGLGIAEYLASDWGQYEIEISAVPVKRQIITYAVFHAGVAMPIKDDAAFPIDDAA